MRNALFEKTFQRNTLTYSSLTFIMNTNKEIPYKTQMILQFISRFLDKIDA